MLDLIKWVGGAWAWLILMGAASSFGRAGELLPVSQFEPVSGAAVLDMKSASGQVTVRVADVGWVTYVVDGTNPGVYRAGGLEVDHKDFRHLPRAGNAIVSDANVVSVEGFGEGVVLWSDPLDSAVVAFGVVGDSLKVNESAVFYSDGIALRIRETFLGKELADLNPPEGLTAADVSSDMTMAVTAGEGSLTVWDIDSGQASQRVEIGPQNGAPIQFLKILPEGDRVLISSLQSRIEVWNLATGVRENEFTSEEKIVSLDVSGNGLLSLVALSNGELLIWNVSDGTQYLPLGENGFETPLQAASFSSGNEQSPLSLWTLDPLGVLQHWNIETGSLLHTIDGTQAPFWPARVALSLDRSVAYIYDEFSDESFIHRIVTGDRYAVASQAVHFMEGQRYALWSNESISVWSYESGPPKLVWERSYESVFSPTFNGEEIKIEWSIEGTESINVIDASTGSLLTESTTDPEPIISNDTGISLQTTQQIRARLQLVEEMPLEESISKIYAAELFNVETDQVVAVLDGRLESQSFQVIDSSTGQKVWAEPSAKGSISWDGKNVAIGIAGNVKVWDVATETVLISKNHSDASFNHVVFSEDGQALAFQFISGEESVRRQSVWRLSDPPVEILEEEFAGRVDVRFTDSTIVLSLEDEEEREIDLEYSLVSGERLDERDSLGVDRSVTIRGAEPFRIKLRVVERIEIEDSVTEFFAIDLRPGRGAQRWIRTLEGGLTAQRFRIERSNGGELDYRTSPEGLWLPELSAYVVVLGDTLGMWNYETGEQIHSINLNLRRFPRSVDSLAYQAQSISLSQDRRRLLIRLKERIFGPDSNEVESPGTSAFVVVDLELKEAFGFPRLTDSREFFPDQNLVRALSRSATSKAQYEIWEFRTASIIGSITNGNAVLGGVLAGALGSSVRFSDVTFSRDSQMVATSSAEGVSFWDLSSLNPGLAFRRGDDGLSLVWDERLVDESHVLQSKSSVLAGDWQNIDSGDSGALKIDATADLERYYRWRP